MPQLSRSGGSRFSPPPRTMRRNGEHHVSIGDAEQEMNHYIARYGLEAALQNLTKAAEALHLDIRPLLPPQLRVINGTGTEIEETSQPIDSEKNYNRFGGGNHKEAKPPRQREPKKQKKKAAASRPRRSRPTPVFFNRKGEAITEARHQGGLTAWETRRAIDAMVAANPRLSRMAALALFRADNPRSRAKNLEGPRRRASKGESSWDTRVKNIIKKHREKTGETLSWQDAHQRALDSLQGSRKAA